MTGSAAVLDLTPGARLALDGVEWTVESFAPQHGRVVLDRSGERLHATVRMLVNHPRCRSLPQGQPAGEQGRQPVMLDDLTSEQRHRLQLRVAHLLETETGFRSGDPRGAMPEEPRDGFDPATTTVEARRRRKVAELRSLGPDEARLLGLDAVSERTLRRWASAYRRFGILGCVDGRMLRRGGQRPSITEPVREAIFAVYQECLHRSRISMAAKEKLIRQYVRERFGPQEPVPSYWTLRRVWVQWFGPGGARQRYVRSAAAAPPSGAHVVVHRPGQVVALDTTLLPVKVRETVFAEPASVHLTLALDVYTHSIVAFRLTLVSDTSVDVAMLLRDVMMPVPLRDGWGEEMEWPYPGVPAAVVAEFAGHRVAGLPFFAPETVTVDHGSVYKNHHLVEAQRVIGTNILPSRVLRPTDKHAVERTFASIQSLLFEVLPGFQGIDVADRGADPEADAVLTVAEMEYLIATWVVKIWQNRRLGEYAPAWDPAGTHSPNSLFATAMEQGGFALQIPPAQLYYQLLPATHVKIHGQRGVKVRGLWYDGAALDPYRHQVSTRGGRHAGKWVVRFDKRDPRYVFFQDPVDAERWHTLRWVGQPAEGETPAFGDVRRDELLRKVRRAGLTPQSDSELLPQLLDLIGGHVPVDQWPTQMSKQDRRQHAREVAQARTAAADRPAPQPPDAAGSEEPDATVVPLRWADRAAQVETAVDRERRRRREQAVPQRPQPPPRLGEAYRRRGLLILPDDDAAEYPDTAGD
ncbi:COG3415 family protein [Micromonospora chersina]|uniref:hypothetical protein n=1 Tax=Micromonospora chersina TaxID=47854 RepID=UPI00371C9089